jgi:RNA polymerase sigma factor
MSDPDKSLALQGDLTAQVLAAGADKRALNTLLHSYMPFIKKCAAGVFFRGQSGEDKLTDAMLAFARAVQTYDPERGAFTAYAAQLIRNRLIDSARKELSAQKHFFPLRAVTEYAVSGEADAAWDAVSLRAHDREEEERNLRLEIEEVNREFAEWGFSWATMIKKCPRQERSRRVASRIAEFVLRDPDLLSGALETSQLPVSRLAGVFPKKALEKYRQYIAALIILSQGEYPYVYSFVPHPVMEEENA